MRIKGKLLVWSILTTAVLALTFDQVAPQSFFHTWLWVILLVSLALYLLAVFLKGKFSISLGLTRNQKFLVLVALALILAAGIYFPRVISEKALIRQAADDFKVILHGQISAKQVDYTLLQLEKGLSRMVDSSDLDKALLPVIRVELYPDIYELKRITGLEDWAAGFTIYQPDGPVIHIPVVKDESGIDETPEHEVVHAVMYQVTGQQIKQLPQWFREGVAQYISEMGFFKLPGRDLTRLQLWFDKENRIPAGEFSSYTPDNSSATESEIYFFYDSSYEFTRYLAKTYGSDFPWVVTEEIKGGKSFAQAMVVVTGQSFEFCYRDWQLVFWGIAP